MRHRFVPVVVAVLAAGCALAGCSPSPAHALGVGSAGAPTTVKAAASADGTVALTGKMVEKCPVAACWFKLQDKTGVATVDVKDAGFVVTDVPVGATVTAFGTLDKSGGEPVLHATGIRW